MKYSRRKILPAIALVIYALATASCSSAGEADFNVVLISIDTLRADHLSCYKYPKTTSPAIDEFRKDAVLFRRCMAQAASTLPSHASIFTSLIPSHHTAFFTRGQSLPGNMLTMAEIFKQKNYRTVSFNDGGQVDAKFGLDQGFDQYKSFTDEQQSFARIVNHTEEWLEKNKKENNKRKFFLFLHTYETHHPYTPAEKYLKQIETEAYDGPLPRHISVELIHQINRGEVTLSDADKKHLVNTYDAEIRSMDDSFKQLTEYLKKNGLYDNTLIIFTSDHGEEFGEHGMWGMHSNSLYNEQLHVPLIVKLPQSRYAGRKVNRIVRSIDILPTLTALLGDKASVELEGVDLVPLMQGRKLKSDIVVISQLDAPKTFVPEAWTIIYKKWKLFNLRLYDLNKDPAETIDLAGQNKHLIKKLNNYTTDYINKKKPAGSSKVNLDDALKDKLKSLGYVN